MNFSKRLKSLFILGLVGFAVLFTAWEVQQRNVNKFQAKISKLEQNINTLSGNLSAIEKLTIEKDLASLAKEEITLRNGIFASLIQLSGGIFFSITAYFTWRNVKTAEENLKTAEEKQITERFSKSIEHLGSEKLEIRLGGIYSLERIAKDSEKDYWQVMEILTAFIREKYRIEREQEPFNFSKTEDEIWDEIHDEYQRDYDYYNEDDDYQEVRRRTPNQEYTHSAPVEVQAVLNAIGRRVKPKRLIAIESIDLSRTELSDVVLTGDLRNINFEGSNLQRARLKDANLSYSNFASSNLEVVQIENVDLQHANFQKSKLQWAKITNVNLKEANLENTNLSESLLRKVVIDNAILSDTNFRESKFIEISLKDADFQDSCLDGVDLSYADLNGLDFRSYSLNKAIFQGANLEKSVLDESYLKDADFEEAHLLEASFKNARLQSAKFKGANLQGVDFTGARIYEADFRSVVNLNPCQVKAARHWKNAIYDPKMQKELGLAPEGVE